MQWGSSGIELRPTNFSVIHKSRLSIYIPIGKKETAHSTQGIAGGTFLYITFFEVLPHELNKPARRLWKVTFKASSHVFSVFKKKNQQEDSGRWLLQPPLMCFQFLFPGSLCGSWLCEYLWHSLHNSLNLLIHWFLSHLSKRKFGDTILTKYSNLLWFMWPAMCHCFWNLRKVLWLGGVPSKNSCDYCRTDNVTHKYLSIQNEISWGLYMEIYLVSLNKSFALCFWSIIL